MGWSIVGRLLSTVMSSTSTYLGILHNTRPWHHCCGHSRSFFVRRDGVSSLENSGQVLDRSPKAKAILPNQDNGFP